jgi:hypothetical protein
MSDVPPLRLIAATQEHEMFARWLELHGNAMVTRILPALQFSAEELLEQISVQSSEFEIDIPPEFYTGSPFESEFDKIPDSVDWYPRMESAILQYYVPSFVFVAIWHHFEQQLATVLA